MSKDKNNDYVTCMGKKPFPYTALKWPFLLVSIICFAWSVYEIGFKGLNYGVDFKGGAKIVYELDPSLKTGDLRKAAEELGLGDVQIIPFGGEGSNQYIVRAKYLEDRDVADVLNKGFAEKLGRDKIEDMSTEVVGPKVSEDLKRDGILSLAVTCGLILIYVGFRFDFLFAPGAIIALIHDVTISAGVFAFFGKEFNLPILAALLTILGYSINDTIVIYDRIRENLTKLPKSLNLGDVIDISLTETFSRTIVTALTVFIVVVTMFFLGGSVLHDFSFCLIVGLIFGSYSSLFIASPIYLGLQKLFPTQGLNKMLMKEEAKRKAVAA